MRDFFFYALCAVLLGLAFVTVSARNLFRSALGLLGVLLCTAALFLLLQAEMVALVQVMVYVGGIMIFVLYAVLLTSELGGRMASPSPVKLAMAVVVACELGITVRDLALERTNIGPNAQPLLNHIATYLVSVSNSSSTCIRLSLMHYFGVTEHGLNDKVSFNRVMGRFGHTVLDNLFTLLFNKKSEAVALQYLQDNLPFVLLGDSHCQRVFHETARFYMLKNPERFALFLQTFSDLLMGLGEEYDEARRTFVQHLGLLLRVTSNVNHKQLARDVLTVIGKFDSESGRDELINQFNTNPQLLRRSFRDIIQQVSTAMHQKQSIESIVQLRSSRRGRKPSFSRVERVATIHQVAYLAQQELAKVG